MQVIKYSTDQYSLHWMMFESNSTSPYLNSGLGKTIRWIYVLQGTLTVEYTKEGKTEKQVIDEDNHLDLKSLTDTSLKFTAGSEDCYIAGIVPLVNKSYIFDVLEVDNDLTIPAENKEKIFIPLNSIIKINNREVKQYRSARVTANKNIKIWTPELDSQIVIFYEE